MSDTEGWLLMKCLYHCLGRAVNEAYRTSRVEYLKALPRVQATCWLCDEHIKWGEITIDHVIPMSIIEDRELYRLIFDHRNFQPAHKQCNKDRGPLTDGLVSDKVLEAIYLFKEK